MTTISGLTLVLSVLAIVQVRAPKEGTMEFRNGGGGQNVNPLIPISLDNASTGISLSLITSHYNIYDE